MYSDIVLPTATWYEKNDLNTSDMHPFIHPLSAAVDPVWEAKSDWEIYKAIAKKFSEVCVGHLGVEKDLVLTPTLHDTPSELAQAIDVKDWKKGECELVPGKTAPQMTVVERDYPNTYKKFTALGPLMAKVGNGGKGIAWNTEREVKNLADLNYPVTDEGVTKGLPRIESDIDACRGRADARAGDQRRGRGEGVGGAVGDHRPRAHAPRAAEGGREDPLPRHPGAAAQDHLQPDLERHRVRARELQRRLHQRPRADPVAHADRPPAVLPGPQVDARVRRGPVRLPAAGGPEDDPSDAGQQAQRQPRDGAQLHHAAPEVGDPLHLHRQPDHAHAVARRADRVAVRDRRASAPASSTTTGSSSSTSTARSRRARW